jgi:DNA repair exonuclease SbcCD nuclease subunit
VKLGIIGDAHLGCADYTEKRRADFAAAFANAIETSLLNGAEGLCLLGDVFDSALMRRNVEAFAATMKEVAPILLKLRTLQVPVLAIAGNHEYGRGREAAELQVLESLGFLRVLRDEEVVIDGCGIIGVPWQSEDELPALPAKVKDLARSSRSSRTILLLHNFIRGSGSIPSHLGEIDQSVADGFDRVFVGHHHDAEELGSFVMPGATEVQNLAERNRQKAIAVYDTKSGRAAFHKLPKTRDVIALDYDVAAFVDREHLLTTLSKDLSGKDLARAFVSVRLTGRANPQCSVTKADLVSLLRERDAFDRYVDMRITRPTKTASAAVHGLGVDRLLQRTFGSQAPKAQRYVTRCTDDDFAAGIVEEILK